MVLSDEPERAASQAAQTALESKAEQLRLVALITQICSSLAAALSRCAGVRER